MGSPIIRKIAIVVGTSRLQGNGAGISTWLSSVVKRPLAASSSDDTKPNYELVVVDSTTPPLPIGPVLDGSYIPAQIRDPSKYATQPIRDWSHFVTSCSGFIFLTPEYNGGYPGPLKNAIDHLCHEWQGKPAVVMSYGSKGGGGAAAQFKTVLEKLRVEVAEKSVQISVPREFISGEHRVTPSAEFLSDYKVPVEQATEDLLKLIQDKA